MGLSLDIQWSIIRTIFYGEALLSTVLTVPLISPKVAVIRLGILLSRVATSEQALRLAGTGVRQSVTMFHPDFDCRHGLNPNSNLGCRLSDVNVNADPAAVLAANRWLRQRLAAKDEELLMARNERNALQLQLEDLALMHRELCKRHERLENKLKSKNT